jgi:hypothetical protein
MKKQSKGFPYKEKKKARTNLPEDKRPHTRRVHSWWRSEEEPKEERAFYVPNIKVDALRYGTIRWSERDKMDVWTLPEVHTLIDMWARISWGTGSKFHKEMSRQARYFRSLWIKQRGRCAITGIPLEGAPGCRGRGIGIDIINQRFGIRKGNIRLVSAPVAFTRYKCKDIRHGLIRSLDPIDYERWPIYFAILKHFQWYIQKIKNPFSEVPVNITFPRPWHWRRSHSRNPWIVFEWWCYYPLSDTIESWESASIEKTTFSKVFFEDDKILISHLRQDHPRFLSTGLSRDRGRGQTLYNFYCDDYEIQLCDPTVDFNEEIIKLAEKGFAGFGRWLRNLDEG